jgi:hypothetical protein
MEHDSGSQVDNVAEATPVPELQLGMALSRSPTIQNGEYAVESDRIEETVERETKRTQQDEFDVEEILVMLNSKRTHYQTI